MCSKRFSGVDTGSPKHGNQHGLKLPEHFSGEGIPGEKRAMGAYFHAAVAPDAPIILEGNGIVPGGDGMGRTLFFAKTADPAFCFHSLRPLQQVLSHQSLDGRGAETGGAQFRQEEPNRRGDGPDDVRWA